MSELTDMLQRSNLHNIISFIISGTDCEPSEYNADQIKNSFDTLFDHLEQMFPSASRENEELFSAINEFSSAHQQAYLYMGVLIGLKLHKTFNSSLEEIPQNPEKSHDENILQILANARIDNELENILKNSTEYIITRKKQTEAYDKTKNIGLTQAQDILVDNAVSAANTTGAVYGRIAYNLGMQDGIKLVSELK